MNSDLLGVIAMITSIIFFAIGLPVQIVKIKKAKSTKGVSLFTQCTILVTTTAWCAYALKISNWYILISNAPGAICAIVILSQFYIYRKRKE